MEITYDSEADALYVQLRDDVPAHHAVDIEIGVAVDLGEDGHIIGLEILGAGKRLTPEELSRVMYRNLVSERAAFATLPP